MRAIRKLQVKKLRKQKGMSQSQLAKALGVTKGSVSLWERGRVPTDEMQQHLCDYFGVSFGELWGLEKGQEMPELDTSEFIPSQDVTYLWSALIAACSMVCKLQGEGNPYSESRRSLEVKTFENYTVITVNGKTAEVQPQPQQEQQPQESAGESS